MVLAAMSIGMVVCSPLGGRLADRLGRRTPTVAGLSLLTLGLAPLALRGGGITTPALLAGLLGPASDGVAGFGAVFLMAAVAALLSALVSVGLHDRNS